MKPRTRSLRTFSRAHQVVERFTKTLRTPSKKRAQSFSNLYQKLYPESAHADSVALDHVQVQDLLPLYVSDEQQGSDVRAVYPLIWEHFQTCEECTEIYNLFGMESPPPGLALRAPKPQPQLAPPAPDPQFVAWSRTENKRAGSFVFTFSPKYIRAICFRSGGSPLLRGMDAETESLLISDSIQWG